MSDAPGNQPNINPGDTAGLPRQSETEMLSISEQFIRTLPQRMEAMEEALRSGAYDRLRNVAHHLKASCTYLGYDDLRDRAMRIEQAAHDQMITDLATRMDELTAFIASIQANLERE